MKRKGKMKTARKKQIIKKLLRKPLSSTEDEFLERLSNEASSVTLKKLLMVTSPMVKSPRLVL
jgi:hypothetical protein